MGYCQRCGEVLFSEKCGRCGLKSNADSTVVSPRKDVFTSKFLRSNTMYDPNKTPNFTRNSINMSPSKSTPSINKPVFDLKSKNSNNAMQKLRNRLSVNYGSQNTNKENTSLPPDFRTKRISLPPLSKQLSMKLNIGKDDPKRSEKIEEEPLIEPRKIETFEKTTSSTSTENLSHSQRIMKLKEKLKAKRDRKTSVDISKIICKICNAEISDERIHLLDYCIHRKCAVCSICNKKIGDSEFIIKNDEINHKDDCIPKNQNNIVYSKSDINQTLKLCSHCNKVLTQEYLVLSNQKTYHNECFTCYKCNETFKDGLYMVFNGKEYHKKCVPKQNKITCHKCEKDISGRYIKSNSRNYHPHCFICFECKIEIGSKIRFAEYDSKAYCENCAKKKYNF